MSYQLFDNDFLASDDIHAVMESGDATPVECINPVGSIGSEGISTPSITGCHKMASVFLKCTFAISLKERTEVFDARFDFVAAVGLGDENAMVGASDNLLEGDNVGTTHDGIGSGGKGFVLDEVEALAVVDESIAGDARRTVIGMGESSVDDEETAIGLDGILTLSGTHRYVAIDDVAVAASHTEMVKDAVDDAGIVAQKIIVTFRLFVCRFVFDEISLEGSHFALIEEGAIDAAPKIPEEVSGGLALLGGCSVVVGGAHNLLDAIHEFAATELVACNVNGFEGAVGIEGD